MKPLKLLTITSRIYMVIFLVLAFFFFAVLYFTIREEVFNSADEVLYNRKMHIVETLAKNGGAIPREVFGYTDFIVRPSENLRIKDHYSDTLIYEAVDNELDEFRKLSTSIVMDGKPYKLEIFVPRLETHEIVEGILWSLLIVFILMVSVFYFTSRYFSRKLWLPFYKTLHQLSEFEVDRTKGLELGIDRIEEFNALNKSISDLTLRVQNTFVNQKQFIENASHEMQTPLAITQSKLELLIGDPHLTESQSEIIQTLINSTQRLARLNKTLLLLSKIENEQFLEKENVEIKPLLDEILANFEDQRENLKIKIDINISGDGVIHTNRILMDLLFSNLIKNAFFHNFQNGSIVVNAQPHKLSVTNTSASLAIPQEKLFQRFFKQSRNPESWGLGLAIAKKICDINRWRIHYSFAGNQHTFSVEF